MLTKPDALDPERDFASEEKAVAAAITITAQVSQNRSIVIQTYLERDAGVSHYHTLVDKLTATVDRQEARLQLDELQVLLEQEEKALKQLTEDYNSIEERARVAWAASNKRGEFKLGAQETAQKSTAATNIKRFQEAIAKRKVEISKCKAVIDKVD